VLALSAVLLVLGGVGYFALNPNWMGRVVAHAGALGLVGLLGSAAAVIAKKRGYPYGKVLAYGILLPIVLGLLAVMFFYLRQHVFYCGGVVVLGVSLLLIVGCSLLPRKATARW
jgi:hypothetical protein